MMRKSLLAPLLLVGLATAACGSSGNSTANSGTGNLQPPSFKNAAVATYSVGTSSKFTVITNEQSAKVTEAGSLPSGLKFVATPGGATISGNPAANTGGVSSVQLKASDSGGSASEKLTIVIDEAPKITSSNVISGSGLSNMNAKITATGYPVPKITLSGTLEEGLSFATSNDGVATISGTPIPNQGDVLNPIGVLKHDIIDTNTVTITATNSSGVVTQSLVIIIYL